jgi:hypothetical protein
MQFSSLGDRLRVAAVAVRDGACLVDDVATETPVVTHRRACRAGTVDCRDDVI